MSASRAVSRFLIRDLLFNLKTVDMAVAGQGDNVYTAACTYEMCMATGDCGE